MTRLLISQPEIQSDLKLLLYYRVKRRKSSVTYCQLHTNHVNPAWVDSVVLPLSALCWGASLEIRIPQLFLGSLWLGCVTLVLALFAAYHDLNLLLELNEKGVKPIIRIEDALNWYIYVQHLWFNLFFSVFSFLTYLDVFTWCVCVCVFK